MGEDSAKWWYGTGIRVRRPNRRPAPANQLQGSKSGYRANSKSALDKCCRLKGLTETQLLTSREQERCDSTSKKPKAESALSLKKLNAFRSISLKLHRRQRVGGGRLTPKPVRANENGAQTPACGPVVVRLTTRTRAGTMPENPSFLHAYPRPQYAVPAA